MGRWCGCLSMVLASLLFVRLSAAQPGPAEVDPRPEDGLLLDSEAPPSKTLPRFSDIVTAPSGPASPASPAAPAPAAENEYFDIGLDGYVRVEAQSLVPDRFVGVLTPAKTKRQSAATVGRNDGFGLADARLNLRAVYRERLYVRLGLDGAVVTYPNAELPAGVLTTSLADAYLGFTFSPAAVLSVGRFKPPFDVEELTPREARFFVHRSLESRGVMRYEGARTELLGRNDQPGFAPGQQLGAMLSSDQAMSLGVFGLGYALAVTNGNSAQVSLNDNDLPAGWLRLVAAWNRRAEPSDDEEGPATCDLRGGGEVGLNGFFNEVTSGAAPTRVTDRIWGAGLDAAGQVLRVHLQGQVLVASSSSVTLHRVPRTYALGGHVQAAVEVPGTGLFPAYRFAILDPIFSRSGNPSDVRNQDRVMHHTLGLTYRVQAWPLVLNAEYTRSLEQAGRAMPNDRLEAAVQVTFR